jgi:hypothetical protein
VRVLPVMDPATQQQTHNKEHYELLTPGDRVRVVGLLSSPQYNGKFGNLERKRSSTTSAASHADVENERWVVKLDGCAEMSFKRQNIMNMETFSVLVIRIEFGYTTEDLDLQIGGVDYAVIMKTVRSILNDSCNIRIVMVVANTAAETLAQLEYHGRKCVMLLKYFPSTKKAWPSCLNVKCMATIKTGMVRCSSCLGPRYCSVECEDDMFDAHKNVCHNKTSSASLFKAGFNLTKSSMETYSDSLDKKYNDFKKFMKSSTSQDFSAFFDICAFCGKKADQICSKCKGMRYCSFECTTNDKKHLQECTRRFCVVDFAFVYTINPKQPFAHDKEGKLMQLGITSSNIYAQAKAYKISEGIHDNCRVKCKEACKLCETEATLWLELDDALGAFRALTKAGMYAMELWDCSIALSFFRKAKQIAQDTPDKMRMSDAFVQSYDAADVAATAARRKVKNTFLSVFLGKDRMPVSPAAGAPVQH